MDDVMQQDGETESWLLWVGLVTMTLVAFWMQATVTEERLVPALNVISDHYNIPDDIAGATLMAAGASSPELFSSIVALFITHSSLGLGTIVGSEIFNQLIICAGSVYASKTGELQLDSTVVIREVGFYALAIGLLYYALHDVESVDDDQVRQYIFISFHEACILFSGYILYVFVCANMERIVVVVGRLLGREQKEEMIHLHTNSQESYGSCGSQEKTLDVPTMPFMSGQKNLSKEPVANWNSVEYFVPTMDTNDEEGKHGAIHRSSIASAGGNFTASIRRGLMSSSIRNSIANTNMKMMVTLFEHSERPSDIRTLHDIEFNEYDGTLRCFMWQKSAFYTKAYFGSNAWHLRWFTIAPEKVSSVPDRKDPDDHRMTYPRFREMFIDKEHFIIQIVHPGEGKKDYTLMAPSKSVFEKVVEQLEAYMRSNCTQSGGSYVEEVLQEVHDDADAHVDLIEFPADGSNFEILSWVLLAPLRFLMHYTIPDVRQLDRHGDTTTTVGVAYVASLMCLLWLIVGSYAMVASLETLAELLDIPEAVIGFTVSAAGTSLPNYVASKVAAENGFGNQAVSNAFGSNSFNIMVGLGLPWVLYTSFGTGFEPYHGLPAEGILESIIILAVVLAVFVLLMLQSGFVILRWHGILFLGLYVAYIVLAVAQVYLK